MRFLVSPGGTWAGIPIAQCTGSAVVATLVLAYGWRTHRLHAAQLARLEMQVREERAGRTKAQRRLREQSKITAPSAGDNDEQDPSSASIVDPKNNPTTIHYDPIGFTKSVYVSRNGTPSTPTRAPSARAIIEMRPNALCGNGSLECLNSYSHIWVIFHFHDNTGGESKAKVVPPRKKDGGKVGVFCCRTPHRPNPVGLSLVRLVGVDEKKGHVHISGMDIIDGTPVIDIKPFIPDHDQAMGSEVTMPKWCEATSDLTPDFHTVIISEQVKEKLTDAATAPPNKPKRKLGKLLSIYEGNVDELCVFIQETARWDGRKRHSKQGMADQWLFRLGDWDFGLKYPGNSEVIVFDCWHPGEMLFDPELKRVTEIDPTNPLHQQYIDAQS